MLSNEKSDDWMKVKHVQAEERDIRERERVSTLTLALPIGGIEWTDLMEEKLLTTEYII